MNILALLQKNIPAIFIIIIISFGVFLRFYDLNWGAPEYFHPDERNIASSVSQLEFPNQMHPHFFAYGSLPIYIYYFSALTYKSVSGIAAATPLTDTRIPFEIAIIVSRFYSALFSVFTLFLLFKTSELLIKPRWIQLCTLLLAVFSVGLIQFSHFGTYESILTFLSLLLAYLLIRYTREKNDTLLYFSIFISSILVAVKVSSLVLIPVPILAYFLTQITKEHILHKVKLFGLVIRTLALTILLMAVTAAVFISTNPFSILDTEAFIGSINYESGVATGTLPVFYTGEFFNTIPLLFQFSHIYPFILNPLLTIMLVPAIIIVIQRMIEINSKKYALILIFFVILLLSQSFLFTKWTRYIIPTLPLAYLIVGIGINEFSKLYRVSNRLIKTGTFILIIISGIWSFSYVMTAYAEADTRIQASIFARQYIPSDSPVVSEVYDLGIVPFNMYLSQITLLDFYDLEHNPDKELEVMREIQDSQYIILPSQRLLATRLNNPEQFPIGNRIYTMLTSGELGFEKIYETPCSIWCQIVYLGNPIDRYEGTAMVFDRPTVMIYKKR